MRLAYPGTSHMLAEFNPIQFRLLRTRHTFARRYLYGPMGILEKLNFPKDLSADGGQGQSTGGAQGGVGR